MIILFYTIFYSEMILKANSLISFVSVQNDSLLYMLLGLKVSVSTNRKHDFEPVARVSLYHDLSFGISSLQSAQENFSDTFYEEKLPVDLFPLGQFHFVLN